MTPKEDELPTLTTSMLHVLLALADGDKHGYAIIKEVSARTDGKVVMSPGTLYPLIRRLLEAALIDESGEQRDPYLDDERRRYYTLTNRGKQAAVAEMNRMRDILEMGRSKKLLKGRS